MTLITMRREVVVATVGHPFADFPPRPDPGLAIQMTVHRCDQGSTAVRLARSEDVNDWFIHARLSDMNGFDCVEMLNGLSITARFFLLAEAYSADEERKAYAWPRTWYLVQPISESFLRALWSAPASPSEHFAQHGRFKHQEKSALNPSASILTSPRSFP